MSDNLSPEEIDAALERVLASASFARARRAQEFLRFVVRAAVAGRTDINGYTIALEVFGKPADFDAVSDPLVRVEAGRVRSRLGEYYSGPGLLDPIVIELERGGYVPVFRRAAIARFAAPPAQHSRSAPRRASVWLLAACGAVVLAVSGALVLRHRGAPADLAPAVDVVARAQKARVLVEPFVTSGGPPDAAIAFGVTEEIMSRLARYGDIEIYVGPGGEAGGPRPDVDYVLSGSIRNSERTIRVAPRLVAAATGRQVWVETYERDYSVDTLWTIVDAVAARVAASVGEPYGELFRAEVARIDGAANAAADAYHCGLRFLFALQVMSEDSQRRARQCFEQVVADDPSSSMVWARLASLYRMQYQQDYDVDDVAKPILDRAYEAALRALDLDYDNAFAHEEVAFLALLRDDRATFEESVARALALRPTADIRTAIGVNFVRMGERERGIPLIDEGIAESPRAPPFFFLGYVVDALRICDFESAFAGAERMEASAWPVSQVFVAASAALSGRNERARFAVERLLELRPDFRERGREIIARGKYGGEVEATLLDGLARAGLELRDVQASAR